MTSTNETSPSNKPSHYAYHVRENAQGKSSWTRIGTVWPHKDGKGYNLTSLGGQIVIRLATEKQD